MQQQSCSLSNKIKVANQNNRTYFVGKHIGFYTSYSTFILKALRRTSFQEFLYEVLFTEKIEEETVNAVDIELFPAAIKKNGLNIVGRCDTFRGRIRLYPKSFYFCDALRRKMGKEMLYTFAGNRARAALIHEILHLKYTSDEKKVRELTDMYFCVYMEKQFTDNPAFLRSLIFNAKKRSKNPAF